MEYLRILNAFDAFFMKANNLHFIHNNNNNNNNNNSNSISNYIHNSNYYHNNNNINDNIYNHLNSNSNNSICSSTTSNSSSNNNNNNVNNNSNHNNNINNYNIDNSNNNDNNNNNSNNFLLWQPWRDFCTNNVNNMTIAAAAAAAQAAAAAFNSHHQYNQQKIMSKDSRLTTKELPTTKWRRDRRLRAAPEYHLPHNIVTGIPTSPVAHSPSPSQNNSSSSPSQQKPLTESTNTTQIIESPLDMSVTSTTMKPRSPPPPYREPLPGSTFATLARPSVITQAPPKRDSNSLISNRENDNRSQESISMCDPVIDEHFRRSLGADYLVLFGNNNKINNKSSSPISPSSGSNSPKMSSSSLASGASSPALSTSPSLSIKPNSPTEEPTISPKQLTPSINLSASSGGGATSHLTKREQKQQPKQQQQHQIQQLKQKSPVNNRRSPSPPPRTTTVMVTNDNSVAHSVDDHFAKALGDTWRKLQAKAKRDEED